MNAARIDNSPRLQRVDKLLATGQKLTTLDIINQAQVCAVNSCVAELRANGRDIKCWREGDIWYYQAPERLGYQPPKLKNWQERNLFVAHRRDS